MAILPLLRHTPSRKYSEYLAEPGDAPKWGHESSVVQTKYAECAEGIKGFQSLLKASQESSQIVVEMSDVVNMATRTVSNPSEKGLQRYVGLEHIQPNTIRITEWGDIQDGTSFTKCFSEGQVLLSRRRVYLRKAAIADFSGICSGDILVFECDPQRLLPEYLVLILHSDGFIGYSLEKAAGSLSPRIKWQDIKKFSFRLPSITVQRRLSSQLEDVLRLHQELKRALENSIRYTISMQQICTTSLVTLQWAGGSETDHGVH